MEAIKVALGPSCSSRHHSITHHPACEAGHCLGFRALDLAPLSQQKIPIEEVDHCTHASADCTSGPVVGRYC